MVHYRNRMTAWNAVLFGQEETPFGGPDSYHGKVVAGYQFAEHPLRSGTRLPGHTARRCVTRERAEDAGVDEFITKPFSPAELRARVREILGS